MALLIPEARPVPARLAVVPDLPDVPRPLVRRAGAEDRAELVRFLGDLSPSSAEHRFLTAIGGRVPAAVLDRLLSGGPGGGALVAYLDGRLVGHALWARSRASSPTAEIALVVADAYQRQGIGSTLLDAMRPQMISGGVERVQVVTGAGNRPVLGMVARRQPGAKAERDGAMLTFDLPVSVSTSRGRGR
jgi:GNAT superfamily N-acetyltransferase